MVSSRICSFLLKTLLLRYFYYFLGPEKASYSFKIPEKQIKSPMDMDKWQKSETYYDILGYISLTSAAIQGHQLNEEFTLSEPVQNVLDAINHLEKLAIETPPMDQPQRFGNMAYRTWHSKMVGDSIKLIETILPAELQDATKELQVYFVDSFGNSTRIDYGTGHELNFIMFLMALFKLKVFKKEDEVAAALRVFDLYLNFVRKLQVTYRMEPAGSHGVWSLDDFQFVPFIFGSAQFAINSPIDPVRFVDDNIVDEYKKQYMFISCIDYIRQVKTGQFAEHSNQLWSISAVPSWSKICTGLIKMYQKEVLSKFPVIQHVYFGSLFTLKTVPPTTRPPVCRLGIMSSMGPPAVPQ